MSADDGRQVEGEVRVTATGTREGVILTFHAPGLDSWGVQLAVGRARTLARELLCEAEWCVRSEEEGAA